MGHASEPPKPLGEVIDEVERIREELLSLQRSLERLESVDGLVSSTVTEG